MRSTSALPFIMTMISYFAIFFIFQKSVSKFPFTNLTDFCIFIQYLLHFLFITSSFSFKNQLFSLHALLSIHKTFSYNLKLYIHHAYFLWFEMTILQALKNLMEYVLLLLLWLKFQDYFYIHQSFSLNIQDLHK